MSRLIARARDARICNDGPRVQLVLDGKCVLDIHWTQADALARALTAKARQAEEVEKGPQIARDQAILIRSGAPFGLSNLRPIQQEALKLAAWDTDLRRYMPRVPDRARSRGALGTPTVIVKPPATAAGRKP